MSSIKSFLQSRNFALALMGVLFAFEIAFNYFIIQKVPYTEIDHIAYMQEVDGFLQGERNYTNIKGDTGPCVYPAGFLYIFSALKILLGDGDIRMFQYFFMALYLVFLFVVYLLYVRGTANTKRLSKALPLMVLLLSASRRIHSIFVLRLFNDCVAMFIAYLSFLAFQADVWTLGCIIFSVSMSVKMNILLFLPGLLVLLTKRFGFIKMALHAALILLVQIIIGLPFILYSPSIYLNTAFNFGRKFFHIWTVNFKFLPEDIFLDNTFHKILLLFQLIFLVVFAFKWTKVDGGPFKTLFRGASVNFKNHRMTGEHILWVLFTSNFIGVVFSRSLHYQFYVWYYHTIPFLLYFLPYPLWFSLLLWLANEVVWNIFPSTFYTSLSLQIINAFLLLGLTFAPASKKAYIQVSKTQSESAKSKVSLKKRKNE